MVRALAAPAILLLALLAAAPDPAAAAPRIAGTIGATTAIVGSVEEGGSSFSVSALWPLDFHGLESGITGFADDFGSVLGALTDPGTGAPAGEAEQLHAAAYAVAWRLDARPFAGPRWESFASGTWGVYYLRDDQLGDTRRRVSSTGWSLGAGLRRGLRGRSTVGAELRYHRLFNDHAGRYVSAALEWGWR